MPCGYERIARLSLPTPLLSVIYEERTTLQDVCVFPFFAARQRCKATMLPRRLLTMMLFTKMQAIQWVVSDIAQSAVATLQFLATTKILKVPSDRDINAGDSGVPSHRDIPR